MNAINNNCAHFAASFQKVYNLTHNLLSNTVFVPKLPITFDLQIQCPVTCIFTMTSCSLPYFHFFTLKCLGGMFFLVLAVNDVFLSFGLTETLYWFVGIGDFCVFTLENTVPVILGCIRIHFHFWSNCETKRLYTFGAPILCFYHKKENCFTEMFLYSFPNNYSLKMCELMEMIVDVCCQSCRHKYHITNR